MKKWVFFFLGMGLILTACKKSSNTACTAVESTLVASAVEKDSVRSFLYTRGVTAIELPAGVFYTLDSSGTGNQPGICSAVAVKYAGYLMGNTASFESFTTEGGTVFSLADVIPGWQKVLAAVKGGSKVTLYIPPSLAYGSTDKRNANGDVVIPANSYLTFTIDVLSVY